MVVTMVQRHLFLLCIFLTVGAQPKPGMIMTQPGNLKCKKILHLVGQTDPIKIKKAVNEALQMCVKNTYTSVSFPAIGTGEICQPVNYIRNLFLLNPSQFMDLFPKIMLLLFLQFLSVHE